jgi:hypothetical protein
MKEIIPDHKIPVERMRIDPEGNFWLQLNYYSDTLQWLVMDREGNPQRIVHLPHESILTHVSDDHLGVRLNDITFAVYENPLNY